MGSLNKFRERVATHGLMGAIRISLRKSTASSRKRQIFAMQSTEDRFTKIYTSNHWNSEESRSGEGSTLENTANLRAALPGIFEKYGVETVLDAPCGDFNWMKYVVEDTQISYIGGDIVRPLIEDNQARYGGEKTSFQHIDLTKDTLPDVDLLICRDCLFHLSYKDIAAVLANVLASNIPLLLTTTNIGVDGPRAENRDISTGDMRPIDLFSPPFGALPAVLEVIDDTQVSSNTVRYMVLLDRDQIARMQSNLSAHLADS